MLEINDLIRTRSSKHLWRVYLHRSTVTKNAWAALLEFFKLICEKPIVDLKLDSLNNLSHIETLAEAFTSNTATRDKTRVANLAKYIYIYQ